MIIDIDHFKSVNDKHGHFVGDKVLVGVSDCVRANIRSSDTFGRWGGEEFLLICPESDSENALAIAEKVRIAVEGADLSIPETVTISIGVAVFADKDTPESITSRADRALYRAKATGRNKACIAPPSSSEYSLCEETPGNCNY